METEIIKTDDSNIVIERTTIDVEINIEQLQIDKRHNEIIIDDIQLKIIELNTINTSGVLKVLLEKEIEEQNVNLIHHTNILNEINKILTIV